MASEFLARSEEMVDGTFRLGALIRRSVRSVVYETEFGDGALPAVIKIREVEPADSGNPGSSDYGMPANWRIRIC